MRACIQVLILLSFQLTVPLPKCPIEVDLDRELRNRESIMRAHPLPAPPPRRTGDDDDDDDDAGAHTNATGSGSVFGPLPPASADSAPAIRARPGVRRLGATAITPVTEQYLHATLGRTPALSSVQLKLSDQAKMSLYGLMLSS